MHRNELCSLCGAPSFEQVLTKVSSGFADVALVRCVVCGLTRQQNVSQSYEPELYEYYKGYSHKPEHELFPEINVARQQGLLYSFRHAPGRRLLDVGCGLGQFVRTASRSGWDARGIDLAKGAIEIAQSHAVSCEVLDFFDSSLETERFDVITMSEFVEHVSTPASFIERAAHLLNAGGLLFLTTPNFASIDRRVLGVDWRVIHAEHLLYFEPTTLRRTVEKCGAFSVLKIDTDNVSGEALRRMVAVVRPREQRSAAHVQQVNSEQKLREGIQSSRLGRIAKRLSNRVLSKFELGSTIKLLARKRA